MQDSNSAAKGRLARVRAFLLEEHRYVFLGTSVLALCGLWLANQAHSPLSLLNHARGLETALYYVLVAWLAVSALALVSKLTHWKGDAYVRTSPFARPAARRRPAPGPPRRRWRPGCRPGTGRSRRRRPPAAPGCA